MDKIIKNIVEIDKKAIKIKEDTERIIKNNDKKLKERLDTMEEEIISNSKRLAKEEFQKRVEEGKNKSDEILKEGLKKYNQLENMYNKKKHKLRSEIFQNLFIKNNVN